MFSVVPNILLAPNMTQNAERKHRTQDANTAHNRLRHEVAGYFLCLVFKYFGRLDMSWVAPELVCFCFCICICICFLFPPNVYSALLNATFFTHIWPTFWIYHFYTIISKFFGIKINFSTFMSWSIYFIAFLTIFVPQWEAIFYIFLFF